MICEGPEGNFTSGRGPASAAIVGVVDDGEVVGLWMRLMLDVMV